MNTERMVNNRFRCVVIGTSAGGLSALIELLPHVKPALDLPFVVTYHICSDSRDEHIPILSDECPCPVFTAEDKAPLQNGTVCLAPPGYHLFIDSPGQFSLSVDEKNCFARPSIDILFESAARVFKSQLLGIILTGANGDGAIGCRMISDAGGVVIVQDPNDATYPEMPMQAIQSGGERYLGTLSEIGIALSHINNKDFLEMLRRIDDAA